MTLTADRVDHQLNVDTIRALAIDTVQKANSGHPGAPMGMAPMAYVLWTRFLRHAPTKPDWPDRDRFVLSAGHASALLYRLLYLTGYDLPLDELKRFRQLGSQYAGTPRVRADGGRRGDHRAARPGLRQRRRHGHRRAPAGGRVQSPGPRDRRSLDVRHLLGRRPPGGHLGRGGQPRRPPAPRQAASSSTTTTASSSTARRRGPGRENVVERFDAYEWHTQRVEDGNDLDAIEAAITAAREDPRPSLIAVRTHIGYGSPHKQDSQKAHGAAARARTRSGSRRRPTASTRTRRSTCPTPRSRHFREAVPRGRGAVLRSATSASPRTSASTRSWQPS